MNRDEMEARVFTRLRDENKSFVSSDDVVDWLQQADTDIAHRQLDLTGELAGTVGVDGDVDLPADFIQARWLRLGTEVKVVFPSESAFTSWKESGDDPGETLGRVFGAFIEFYPVPDSATAFTLRYYRTPTVMSSGSSTSEHPEHLHEKHVYFAEAEGQWKRGEDTKGDRAFARYEDGLRPKDTGRRRRFVGPLSVVPAAGVFDEDLGDPEDL